MRKSLQLFLIPLLYMSVIMPGYIVAAEKPLKLGVFPRQNATTTLKSFRPMADYLAQKLGRKVELVTSSDFTSFWNNVAAQEYDIVHYNQYHYIKSSKAGYRAILKNEEFGKSTIRAAIYIRKDSGIHSLHDLKGKTVMFGGDSKAMISYVVPTAMLRRAGLKRGDYREKFSKNPPNTLLSVYFGQADAAGTGDIILKVPSVTNAIDTAQVTMLAESEPLAHILWALKDTIDPELGNKIQDAMLALNDSAEGKKILKQAKLTGLHKALDSEYNIHRKYLQEVFGDNY